MKDSPFPTQYQNISDTELYGLFHSSVWFGTENRTGLTLEQKVDAMQELVNREAAQQNTDPVKVTAENINTPESLKEGTSLGAYDSVRDYIALDSGFVEKSAVPVLLGVDQQGNPVITEKSVEAGNLQNMSTALHEYQHAVQEQSRTNPDIYDDKTHEANIQANMSVYYSSPYDIYSIQATEKEANQVSFDRSKEIIEAMERTYGPEPGKEAFFDMCQRDSFEKALESAESKYGPDVEKELQNVINDIYNHNNVPQNPSPAYVGLFQAYVGQLSAQNGHAASVAAPANTEIHDMPSAAAQEISAPGALPGITAGAEAELAEPGEDAVSASEDGLSPDSGTSDGEELSV